MKPIKINPSKVELDNIYHEKETLLKLILKLIKKLLK